MRLPKNIRVLYISYDGILDPLGSSQILPYLRGLCRDHGVRPALITFEKKKNLKNRPALLQYRRELKDQGIIWIRLKYHKAPSVPATAYDLICAIFVSFLICIKFKPQLIHARSYVAGAVGLVLRSLLRTKLVFDMRGFWVDERTEARIWPERSLLPRLGYALENRLMAKSDVVITLTEAAKTEVLNKWHFMENGRVSVIPTCVDMDKFDCGPRADENREFLLIYSGSVSTWSMPGEMMRLLSLARTFDPDTRFAVLTKEKIFFEELLKKSADTCGSIDVFDIDHADVPRYLSRAKAGLALYRPGYSRAGCCPTKIGEYLACGLPVLINSGIGDSDKIIENENVGCLIKGFSSRDFQCALDKLRALLAEGPGLRLRCRAAAKKYFSLDEGVDRYFEAYQRAVL